MTAESQVTLKNRRILIVDDHRNIRVTLRFTLEGEGAMVDEAENCAAARIKLNPTAKGDLAYDVILLDIRLSDGNGLDVLKHLSESGKAHRVIMISGEGTVTEAYQATQMGAFDYIEKPFVPERILVSVRRLLEFTSIQTAHAELARKVLKGQELQGEHPSIEEVRTMMKRVAPTNGRVLILGESGTGKELVAKGIHRDSQRADKPLIKVNCAAIPHSLIESELFGHEKGAFTGAIKTRRGLFEQADGGTLFLDEIGELSLDVQAKLLRVLQSGEMNRVGSEKTISVDVRVLAATHRDLKELVQSGEFREDLYYRLNVVSIPVPALRERGGDIALLAKFFLKEACEEHSVGERTLSDQALRQLAAYSWPGNIRELKNVMERTAILSEHSTIDEIDDLAAQGSGKMRPSPGGEAGATADFVSGGGLFRYETGPAAWHEFHSEVDRAFIKFILQRAEGNVSEAARILCLERAYLHRLMKKLGVQRDVVVSG